MFASDDVTHDDLERRQARGVQAAVIVLIGIVANQHGADTTAAGVSGKRVPLARPPPPPPSEVSDAVVLPVPPSLMASRAGLHPRPPAATVASRPEPGPTVLALLFRTGRRPLLRQRPPRRPELDGASALDDIRAALRHCWLDAANSGDLRLVLDGDGAQPVCCHRALVAADASISQLMAVFPPPPPAETDTFTSVTLPPHSINRVDLLARLEALYTPDFLQLLAVRDLRDVTVLADEAATAAPATPNAHRFLLATRSGYFAALFDRASGWADASARSFRVAAPPAATVATTHPDVVAAAVEFFDDSAALDRRVRQMLGPVADATRPPACAAAVDWLAGVAGVARFLQFADLTLECQRVLYVLCHDFCCACARCIEGGVVARALRAACDHELEAVAEDAFWVLENSLFSCLQHRSFYDLAPPTARARLLASAREHYLTPAHVLELLAFLEPYSDAALDTDGSTATSPGASGPTDRLLARLPPPARTVVAALDADASRFCAAHFAEILAAHPALRRSDRHGGAAGLAGTRRLAAATAASVIPATDSLLARALDSLSTATVVDVLAAVDDACVRLRVLLDELDGGEEGNGTVVRDDRDGDVEVKGRVLKLLQVARSKCITFAAKRWMNVDARRLSLETRKDIAVGANIPIEDLTSSFTGLLVDPKGVAKRRPVLHRALT
ncbi:hypothetical protein HK405_015595 [Cladochytrium tenue]|nr:hypothetical protein HK405_015595 [Cladochytrium tenue]